MRRQFGQGAAPHFFMQLGQLARHRGGRGRPAPPPWPPGVSARRWAGFKKDQGGAQAFQFFQRAARVRRPWTAESPRTETGRTAGPTAPAPSAPPTRPARHGPAMPSSIAARTSLKPGSETSGVPASLTSAMRAPSCSLRQQARPLACGIVVVIGGERPGDAVDGQQLGGDAGILGGDQVAGLQHLQRPQGDVAGIADGGGDDIKTRRQLLKSPTCCGLPAAARRLTVARSRNS